MVLITLLTACLKSPAVVSSPSAEQWPAWMILEMEQDESVPTSVSNRLTEVAQEHNITLQLQPTPADFEIAKHVGTVQSPVCWSWRVLSFMLKSMDDSMGSRYVKIDIFDGTEHISEELTIPVFHQFHHERHREALEAALANTRAKVHSLLNKQLLSSINCRQSNASTVAPTRLQSQGKSRDNQS